MFTISVAHPACAATWEGVFEGTIGKAKVIVELNAGEEKSDYKGGYRSGSRYSYLPKPRDINLMLDAEGESLRFTETLRPHTMFADEEDKKITGSWEIKVQGERASGTWMSPKGDKRLPIVLTRKALVPAAKISSLSNQLSVTYEELWLERVTFADAGLAKKFPGVEVRFVKDSSFGTRYPVLGKFPDSAQKTKINAMLMDMHRTAVRAYRECFNGVPVDWSDSETELVLDFKITYATERLLSFVESGSVFCGGAHPNNYVNPQTFDLTVPQPIGSNDVLDLIPESFGRIFKLANMQERIAFERFALGQWNANAAKDKEQGSNCIDGWIFGSAEGEKEFSLSFTEQGLAVTRTDYPHVASVCLFAEFNPTIIPWTDLKPWLRPGQTLLTGH